MKQEIAHKKMVMKAASQVATHTLRNDVRAELSVSATITLSSNMCIVIIKMAENVEHSD